MIPSPLWFLCLVNQLLHGEPTVLALLEKNPFPNKPPRYIRAKRYLYNFTTSEEAKKKHDWWKREYYDDYLPVIELR